MASQLFKRLQLFLGALLRGDGMFERFVEGLEEAEKSWDHHAITHERIFWKFSPTTFGCLSGSVLYDDH